jgi:hypothetical protein
MKDVMHKGATRRGKIMRRSCPWGARVYVKIQQSELINISIIRDLVSKRAFCRSSRYSLPARSYKSLSVPSSSLGMLCWFVDEAGVLTRDPGR